MCGIAGIVSANRLSSEADLQLDKMQARLQHRGPEDHGRYLASNVRLAHQRLSIIDLEGGKQPLYNETNTLVLIANAEIYNFIELRQTLEGRGHDFRTRSDCETIIHLYEEYGIHCVKYLRGMFAFALWDTDRQQLLLARDRIGEKPLYLWQDDKSLFFSSEMKSLLASNAVPKSLDPAAIDLYMHLQYIPEPGTALKHVRKLPAGCTLTVAANLWKINSQCFWRFTDAPPIDREAGPAIREKLDEISGLILRSDVPVGIALSGGIDSSAIACLAARHKTAPVHALSVGYPGRPDHDERDLAKETAWSLGIPFHEMELPVDRFVHELPWLAKSMDDPVADVAAFSHMAVMRLAHECGIKVLLFGLGGDEIFWGYDWLQQAITMTAAKDKARSSWWNRSKFIESILCHPLCFRYGHHSSIPVFIRSLFQQIWQAGLISRAYPSEAVCQSLLPSFQHARRMCPRLFTDDFQSQVPDRNNVSSMVRSREEMDNVPLAINRILCDTWLKGNCLTLADRLGMACSVEPRVPLLDAKLLELVVGLRKCRPDHAKGPKHWLREALDGIVPQKILQRPKSGFRPPVDQWINGAITRYGSMLPNGSLAGLGIIDPHRVAQALTNFYNKGAYGFVMYKLILLELWHRNVVLQESMESVS